MDVKILASGAKGRNTVALLEQTDYLDMTRAGEAVTRSLYIVTLVVHDRAGKAQTWARTDLDPSVARELYDVAVAEFIAAEVEP
jgi:hypothetical protein